VGKCGCIVGAPKLGNGVLSYYHQLYGKLRIIRQFSAIADGFLIAEAEGETQAAKNCDEV